MHGQISSCIRFSVGDCCWIDNHQDRSACTKIVNLTQLMNSTSTEKHAPAVKCPRFSPINVAALKGVNKGTENIIEERRKYFERIEEEV